jgi:hypothetical protein
VVDTATKELKRQKINDYLSALRRDSTIWTIYDQQPKAEASSSAGGH